MDLLKYFPGTPRAEQQFVLEAIQSAFNSGKRYVIVQAPTGVGKSHIGATLARSTSKPQNVDELLTGTPQTYKRISAGSVETYGAYVLTTTKQLQNQYSEIFKESSQLKGRENYTCGIDATVDASIAPCVYNTKQMAKCANQEYCPYIEAFRGAVTNNFSELNYSMYFTLPEALQKKELLICDEASELEDQLISHFKLDISYTLLNFLGIPHQILAKDDAESGYLWICDIDNTVSGMNVPIKKVMSSLDITKYKALKALKEKLGLLRTYWHSCEFTVELKPKGVCIGPLKVNRLSRVVFSSAEKIVFLSATVINHIKMAESLGIDQNEYEFIDVPSGFDPKKSPIYLSPAKYDMRYDKIDSQLPTLVADVLKLCEYHKDEKGIIHTNSFKINEAFKKAVGGNPRFLIREDGVDNETLLEEHFSRKDPTVLISPSLAFGTSLDDEHGRFQIITKLPYLPLSDKRVKILSKRDFDWYQMKMWVKLIQMCGRCTRSKTDHSATYIFDESIIGAIKRYQNKLPKWFVNRLV